MHTFLVLYTKEMLFPLYVYLEFKFIATWLELVLNISIKKKKQ
jgi:hypothetical protein